MAIQTMQEKFLHELGDIYDAEHRFLKGQQEMLAKASNQRLKTMIQQHIAESEEQVKVLDQVFGMLGQRPQGVKCDGAIGIVTEAQQNLQEASAPTIRDCLIGGAAAKVEHYEIAGYRGLMLGAEKMGQTEIKNLLHKNLEQEEQTATRIEKAMPDLLLEALRVEGSQGKVVTPAPAMPDGGALKTPPPIATAETPSAAKMETPLATKSVEPSTGMATKAAPSGTERDERVTVKTSGASDILIDDTGKRK